jgi:hypothetical protein
MISNGLVTMLIISILIMPDVALDLLLQSCSFLFDNFLELIHLAFVFIEYSLDHIIESIFHTGLHDTQIIVFYILGLLGLAGLYSVFRILPSIYNSLLARYLIFVHRKKMSFLYRWREQTWLSKIAISSASIVAICGYSLFFI